MSTEEEWKADMMSRCASCGVKGGVDIKLKDCGACHLVQYCGVKCQKQHWSSHKHDCKKRAAELRDKLLFKQPESNHLGDCPICFLPLSVDMDKSCLMTCCSKSVCNGCSYANDMREAEEGLYPKCPFCRLQLPTPEEAAKRNMDRAAANDPLAMRLVGTSRCQSKDYQTAFGYFFKAAKLGDGLSHYYLAGFYQQGLGVGKDESKEMYHFEQAAIAGHPAARHRLGMTEWENGQYERAFKHFIIATRLGQDESLEALKMLYKSCLVSKDELAAALRGHQAAVDATKSPQREMAERKSLSTVSFPTRM